MQKEYLTEYKGQFNVTKYTLSSGTEVILSEDEEKELFEESKAQELLIDALEELNNEVIKIRTRLEHKQKIIDTYLEFQSLLKQER